MHSEVYTDLMRQIFEILKQTQFWDCNFSGRKNRSVKIIKNVNYHMTCIL